MQMCYVFIEAGLRSELNNMDVSLTTLRNHCLKLFLIYLAFVNWVFISLLIVKCELRNQ